MSQHFQSLKNTGSIKTQLAQLAQEMSSGQVADLGQHLNGDTSDLIGLNHEIALLDTFAATNSETARALGAMQLTLERTDAQRESASSSFLLITADSNRNQVENAASTAKFAFTDTINALNSSSGGRALFSGTAVDQEPFAAAETMISDIAATIGGAATKDDIIIAIDDWFGAAGGGFETVGYLGNQENQMRALNSNSNIEIGVRGDDTEVRELLKGFAYAAVAHDISATLSDRDYADLVNVSGVKLLEAAEGLSHLQGGLGEVEESVALSQSSNAAQLASFEIARSDLVKADPFETATKLQDIQTQLETHFAVTARLSRLNLMDFLR